MNETIISMSDGWKVHAFIVEPSIPPKGHVHLMHGMAEHISRYKEFATVLANAGYIATGHDHRGHGKTAKLNGIIGHVSEQDGFDRLVQDAREVILHYQQQVGKQKFFLFGHSMGSFVVRRYIQIYGSSVDAVILSGTGGNPGLARYAGLGFAWLLGKKNGYTDPDVFLDSLVFGNFIHSVSKPETPFDWLSRDREAVQAYIADEQCGFVPTTRFFADLFQGLGIIHQENQIQLIPKDLPILLFSGTDDPVGKKGKAVWEVATQFDKAGIEDVTVLLFEGGRHEMLNEVNRESVYRAVLKWMEER